MMAIAKGRSDGFDSLIDIAARALLRDGAIAYLAEVGGVRVTVAATEALEQHRLSAEVLDRIGRGLAERLVAHNHAGDEDALLRRPLGDRVVAGALSGCCVIRRERRKRSMMPGHN